MRALTSFAVLLLLAGCGGLQLPFGGGRGAEPPAVSAAQAPGAGTPRPAERPGGGTAAAAAPVSAAGSLGTTLATLGDATRGGLWLETPLVSAERAGRVVTAGGRAVDVTLLPAGGPRGGGSRLSLQAMQALGLALTDISEVSVEAL